MESPGTPNGAQPEQRTPHTKRARTSDEPDPAQFDGILLETHAELDKNNSRLKSKDYVTLMASMLLDCNRARREILDRHKNMSKKGEEITEMKERLPFTKNFVTIDITKQVERAYWYSLYPSNSS